MSDVRKRTRLHWTNLRPATPPSDSSPRTYTIGHWDDDNLPVSLSDTVATPRPRDLAMLPRRPSDSAPTSTEAPHGLLIGWIVTGDMAWARGHAAQRSCLPGVSELRATAIRFAASGHKPTRLTSSRQPPEPELVCTRMLVCLRSRWSKSAEEPRPSSRLRSLAYNLYVDTGGSNETRSKRDSEAPTPRSRGATTASPAWCRTR